MNYGITERNCVLKIMLCISIDSYNYSSMFIQNSKIKHSRYSTRYIIYRLFSNLYFAIIINLLVETNVCLASDSLIVFLKISICINICSLITPKFISIFTVCNKQIFLDCLT